MTIKHAFLGLLLISLLLPASAQESFREYYWERAEFSLEIPATWDEPLITSSDDRNLETLFLAQDFAENPAIRPPGIPIITLTYQRQRPEDFSPYQQLVSLMQAIEIEPIGSLPFAFLEHPSEGTIGTNRDSSLVGIGQVATFEDGSMLFLIGRSTDSAYPAFQALFNAIASSIVRGSNRITTPPAPGIIWQTVTNPADGEWTLLDPVSITVADDHTLLVTDRISGILQLDAATGTLLDRFAVDLPFEPAATAFSADGTLYIADLACSCIRRFTDGTEIDPISGFAGGAPRNLTLTADGSLYASDLIDNQPVIVQVGTDQFWNDPVWIDQPFLLTDRRGAVIAVTQDGSVFQITPSGIAQQSTLELPATNPVAVTVDASNHLLLLTPQGSVLTFDTSGTALSQFGQPAGANWIVSALAASSDGTLYTASSDGFSGQISALRLGVETGRIGASHLIPSISVQGDFTDPTANAAHVWTFDGLRGDRITLTALASFDTPQLDTALRVLAPDGSELAFADQDESGTRINPADPQITLTQLPQDGLYIVLVEQRFGEGRYTLGYTRSETITLTDPVTTLSGNLRPATPIQSYLLEARAGQVLTVTLTALGSTLDPVVRIYDANGNLIAENDDALDPLYGRDARIEALRLDRTGTFQIDAAIFDGEGRYQLEIIIE